MPVPKPPREDRSLRGRRVLVTGGSRGIGRAIAEDLGRAGADVAVGYVKDRTAAESLVLELERMGRAARAFGADLSRPPEVHRLLQEVGAWTTRLDGLVTSGGIYRGSPVEGTSASEWEEVLQVDLIGSFETIREGLPLLRTSKDPSVVTVSSVLGSHPAAGGVAYQSAKAGVEQMTRVLARELAPRVRVNAVAPGFIRTDLNRGGHEDPGYHAFVSGGTPLGRWGEPEDVAPAVRFLLGPGSRGINGVVLAVDGGIPLG